MPLTNFAALSDEQILIRSMRLWKAARKKSFVARFEGTTSESMIQRITELKQSEKGTRALITLVHDLEGDGTAGDRFLEGNEEAMISSEQEIEVDMLRHAVRHKGRMADQKSIVNFRNEGNDKLSYWLANRWDQMAFLHLSGVSYAFHNNLAPRDSSQLPLLGFAGDASKPLTAGRHKRWDGAGLVAADTSAVAAAHTPTYDMLIEMQTAAQNAQIRPIRTTDGIEHFNVFMTPDGIKHLKKDEAFREAYQNALPRSENNPLFKGTNVIMLDGLAIFPFRDVINTKGAAAGSKWGSSGNVDGQRVLLCGAQALAKADIGPPRWVEKEFDFDNQPAISAGKISGYLRPQFKGVDTGNVEDFSLIAVDTAI